MLKRGLSDANEELITQFQTGPLPANLELAEVRRAMDASAETALDLNDMRNAKNLIGILESQPASAQGYVAQGRFALLQGNLPDAMSFLTKALAADSGSPQAMHWLAVAEHRSGDDASAQLHVSQILQRHPGFLPALEDKILFAADRKDFQVALRAQLQRMALMSDPPASEYCRLGAIWMKMSNPTAAESVLLKGTLKDPTAMCVTSSLVNYTVKPGDSLWRVNISSGRCVSFLMPMQRFSGPSRAYTLSLGI